ncbi:hypothetical protein IQ07DRAFT_241684 [Pyrenochaeta sp. DS3sAY3a]|nr:hypothetical protein IQ07DRAFT_241684 [Pyrenochaeta sp. DS3sAY3a]
MIVTLNQIIALHAVFSLPALAVDAAKPCSPLLAYLFKSAGKILDVYPCTGPCVDATPNKCKDKCVDLQTDFNNCGQCGKICPINESCVSGLCQDTSVCYSLDNECGSNSNCTCLYGLSDLACVKTAEFDWTPSGPCNSVDGCPRGELCLSDYAYPKGCVPACRIG